MKNIIIISFFLFIIQTEINANIKNTIIGKVEQEIITSIDLHDQIRLNLYSSNLEETKENYLNEKKAALDRLIERAIKKIEIDKYKIEVYGAEELTRNLEEISKRLGVENLRLDFENKKLNYNLMREGLILDLKWNTLIFSLYKNQININPIEIQNRVEEVTKTFNKIENYNLSEIVLKTSADNEEQYKKIMKLNDDGEFTKAVKQFSNSTSVYKNGNLGWFEKKELNEEYIKNIENLKVGNISSLIKIEEGFLILRLNNKKNEEKAINQKKTRENILANMKNQKLVFYSRNHFNNIKSNVLIKVK
jgi:parvulin-like peptidyl-prolyl isomerase